MCSFSVIGIRGERRFYVLEKLRSHCSRVLVYVRSHSEQGRVVFAHKMSFDISKSIINICKRK